MQNDCPTETNAHDQLETLVQTPSVSCTNAQYDQSNMEVINHLANWLDGMGFDTQVQEVPETPGKANLIATAGARDSADPADPAAGLVLAGHTDTVPCNEARWQHEPFALTNADSRFYGLGSCDMKGFFPCALQALARHDLKNLTAPVTVVATSDEESSMAGARYLQTSRALQAQACVVGEPTSLQPVYGHKGVIFMSITLRGASGHSSNPALGVNALDAMHGVIGELINFRQELGNKWQNPGFAVSVPTLNLGCMSAGDNPNRICDHAQLQIDLRLLPGMDVHAIVSELEKRLNNVAESHRTPLTLQQFNNAPALATQSDSALVRYLEGVSGKQAGTVAYGTEGPFFDSLGMDTVVFGPGSIDQAHQPNEYLAHDQINPAIDTLAGLINHYCR